MHLDIGDKMELDYELGIYYTASINSCNTSLLIIIVQNNS